MDFSVGVVKDALLELNIVKGQTQAAMPHLTNVHVKLDRVRQDLGEIGHKMSRASQKAKKNMEAAGFDDVLTDP